MLRRRRAPRERPRGILEDSSESFFKWIADVENAVDAEEGSHEEIAGSTATSLCKQCFPNGSPQSAERGRRKLLVYDATNMSLLTTIEDDNALTSCTVDEALRLIWLRVSGYSLLPQEAPPLSVVPRRHKKADAAKANSSRISSYLRKGVFLPGVDPSLYIPGLFSDRVCALFVETPLYLDLFTLPIEGTIVDPLLYSFFPLASAARIESCSLKHDDEVGKGDCDQNRESDHDTKQEAPVLREDDDFLWYVRTKGGFITKIKHEKDSKNDAAFALRLLATETRRLRGPVVYSSRERPAAAPLELKSPSLLFKSCERSSCKAGVHFKGSDALVNEETIVVVVRVRQITCPLLSLRLARSSLLPTKDSAGTTQKEQKGEQTYTVSSLFREIEKKFGSGVANRLTVVGRKSRQKGQDTSLIHLGTLARCPTSSRKDGDNVARLKRNNTSSLSLCWNKHTVAFLMDCPQALSIDDFSCASHVFITLEWKEPILASSAVKLHGSWDPDSSTLSVTSNSGAMKRSTLRKEIGDSYYDLPFGPSGETTIIETVMKTSLTDIQKASRIRQFLSLASCPFRSTNDGKTALMIAASLGNWRCCIALCVGVEAQRNWKDWHYYSLTQQRDREGNTALMYSLLHTRRETAVVVLLCSIIESATERRPKEGGNRSNSLSTVFAPIWTASELSAAEAIELLWNTISESSEGSETVKKSAQKRLEDILFRENNAGLRSHDLFITLFSAVKKGCVAVLSEERDDSTVRSKARVSGLEMSFRGTRLVLSSEEKVKAPSLLSATPDALLLHQYGRQIDQYQNHSLLFRVLTQPSYQEATFDQESELNTRNREPEVRNGNVFKLIVDKYCDKCLQTARNRAGESLLDVAMAVRSREKYDLLHGRGVRHSLQWRKRIAEVDSFTFLEQSSLSRAHRRPNEAFLSVCFSTGLFIPLSLETQRKLGQLMAQALKLCQRWRQSTVPYTIPLWSGLSRSFAFEVLRGFLEKDSTLLLVKDKAERTLLYYIGNNWKHTPELEFCDLLKGQTTSGKTAIQYLLSEDWTGRSVLQTLILFGRPYVVEALSLLEEEVGTQTVVRVLLRHPANMKESPLISYAERYPEAAAGLLCRVCTKTVMAPSASTNGIGGAREKDSLASDQESCISELFFSENDLKEIVEALAVSLYRFGQSSLIRSVFASEGPMRTLTRTVVEHCLRELSAKLFSTGYGDCLDQLLSAHDSLLNETGLDVKDLLQEGLAIALESCIPLTHKRRLDRVMTWALQHFLSPLFLIEVRVEKKSEHLRLCLTEKLLRDEGIDVPVPIANKRTNKAERVIRMTIASYCSSFGLSSSCRLLWSWISASQGKPADAGKEEASFRGGSSRQAANERNGPLYQLILSRAITSQRSLLARFRQRHSIALQEASRLLQQLCFWDMLLPLSTRLPFGSAPPLLSRDRLYWRPPPTCLFPRETFNEKLIDLQNIDELIGNNLRQCRVDLLPTVFEILYPCLPRPLQQRWLQRLPSLLRPSLSISFLFDLLLNEDVETEMAEAVIVHLAGCKSAVEDKPQWIPIWKKYGRSSAVIPSSPSASSGGNDVFRLSPAVRLLLCFLVEDLDALSTLLLSLTLEEARDLALVEENVLHRSIFKVVLWRAESEKAMLVFLCRCVLGGVFPVFRGVGLLRSERLKQLCSVIQQLRAILHNKREATSQKPAQLILQETAEQRKTNETQRHVTPRVVSRRKASKRRQTDEGLPAVFQACGWKRIRFEQNGSVVLLPIEDGGEFCVCLPPSEELEDTKSFVYSEQLGSAALETRETRRTVLDWPYLWAIVCYVKLSDFIDPALLVQSLLPSKEHFFVTETVQVREGLFVPSFLHCSLQYGWEDAVRLLLSPEGGEAPPSPDLLSLAVYSRSDSMLGAIMTRTMGVSVAFADLLQYLDSVRFENDREGLRALFSTHSSVPAILIPKRADEPFSHRLSVYYISSCRFFHVRYPPMLAALFTQDVQTVLALQRLGVVIDTTCEQDKEHKSLLSAVVEALQLPSLRRWYSVEVYDRAIAPLLSSLRPRSYQTASLLDNLRKSQLWKSVTVFLARYVQIKDSTFSVEEARLLLEHLHSCVDPSLSLILVQLFTRYRSSLSLPLSREFPNSLVNIPWVSLSVRSLVIGRRHLDRIVTFTSTGEREDVLYNAIRLMFSELLEASETSHTAQRKVQRFREVCLALVPTVSSQSWGRSRALLSTALRACECMDALDNLDQWDLTGSTLYFIPRFFRGLSQQFFLFAFGCGSIELVKIAENALIEEGFDVGQTIASASVKYRVGQQRLQITELREEDPLFEGFLAVHVTSLHNKSCIFETKVLEAGAIFLSVIARSRVCLDYALRRSPVDQRATIGFDALLQLLSLFRSSVSLQHSKKELPQSWTKTKEKASAEGSDAEVIEGLFVDLFTALSSSLSGDMVYEVVKKAAKLGRWRLFRETLRFLGSPSPALPLLRQQQMAETNFGRAAVILAKAKEWALLLTLLRKGLWCPQDTVAVRQGASKWDRVSFNRPTAFSEVLQLLAIETKRSSVATEADEIFSRLCKLPQSIVFAAGAGLSTLYCVRDTVAKEVKRDSEFANASVLSGLFVARDEKTIPLSLNSAVFEQLLFEAAVRGRVDVLQSLLASSSAEVPSSFSAFFLLCAIAAPSSTLRFLLTSLFDSKDDESADRHNALTSIVVSLMRLTPAQCLDDQAEHTKTFVREKETTVMSDSAKKAEASVVVFPSFLTLSFRQIFGMMRFSKEEKDLTALSFLCWRGFEGVVLFFLEKCIALSDTVSQRSLVRSLFLHSSSASALSPLQCCLLQGRVSVVMYLLQNTILSLQDVFECRNNSLQSVIHSRRLKEKRRPVGLPSMIHLLAKAGRRNDKYETIVTISSLVLGGLSLKEAALLSADQSGEEVLNFLEEEIATLNGPSQLQIIVTRCSRPFVPLLSSRRTARPIKKKKGEVCLPTSHLTAKRPRGPVGSPLWERSSRRSPLPVSPLIAALKNGAEKASLIFLSLLKQKVASLPFGEPIVTVRTMRHPCKLGEAYLFPEESGRWERAVTSFSSHRKEDGAQQQLSASAAATTTNNRLSNKEGRRILKGEETREKQQTTLIELLESCVIGDCSVALSTIFEEFRCTEPKYVDDLVAGRFFEGRTALELAIDLGRSRVLDVLKRPALLSKRSRPENRVFGCLFAAPLYWNGCAPLSPMPLLLSPSLAKKTATNEERKSSVLNLIANESTMSLAYGVYCQRDDENVAQSELSVKENMEREHTAEQREEQRTQGKRWDSSLPQRGLQDASDKIENVSEKFVRCLAKSGAVRRETISTLRGREIAYLLRRASEYKDVLKLYNDVNARGLLTIAWEGTVRWTREQTTAAALLLRSEAIVMAVKQSLLDHLVGFLRLLSLTQLLARSRSLSQNDAAGHDSSRKEFLMSRTAAEAIDRKGPAPLYEILLDCVGLPGISSASASFLLVKGLEEWQVWCTQISPVVASFSEGLFEASPSIGKGIADVFGAYCSSRPTMLQIERASLCIEKAFGSLVFGGREESFKSALFVLCSRSSTATEEKEEEPLLEDTGPQNRKRAEKERLQRPSRTDSTTVMRQMLTDSRKRLRKMALSGIASFVSSSKHSSIVGALAKVTDIAGVERLIRFVEENGGPSFVGLHEFALLIDREVTDEGNAMIIKQLVTQMYQRSLEGWARKSCFEPELDGSKTPRISGSEETCERHFLEPGSRFDSFVDTVVHTWFFQRYRLTRNCHMSGSSLFQLLPTRNILSSISGYLLREIAGRSSFALTRLSGFDVTVSITLDSTCEASLPLSLAALQSFRSLHHKLLRCAQATPLAFQSIASLFFLYRSVEVPTSIAREEIQSFLLHRVSLHKEPIKNDTGKVVGNSLTITLPVTLLARGGKEAPLSLWTDAPILSFLLGQKHITEAAPAGLEAFFAARSSRKKTHLRRYWTKAMHMAAAWFGDAMASKDLENKRSSSRDNGSRSEQPWSDGERRSRLCEELLETAFEQRCLIEGGSCARCCPVGNGEDVCFCPRIAIDAEAFAVLLRRLTACTAEIDRLTFCLPFYAKMIKWVSKTQERCRTIFGETLSLVDRLDYSFTDETDESPSIVLSRKSESSNRDDQKGRPAFSLKITGRLRTCFGAVEALLEWSNDVFDDIPNSAIEKCLETVRCTPEYEEKVFLRPLRGFVAEAIGLSEQKVATDVREAASLEEGLIGCLGKMLSMSTFTDETAASREQPRSVAEKDSSLVLFVPDELKEQQADFLAPSTARKLGNLFSSVLLLDEKARSNVAGLCFNRIDDHALTCCSITTLDGVGNLTVARTGSVAGLQPPNGPFILSIGLPLSSTVAASVVDESLEGSVVVDKSNKRSHDKDSIEATSTAIVEEEVDRNHYPFAAVSTISEEKGESLGIQAFSLLEVVQQSRFRPCSFGAVLYPEPTVDVLGRQGDLLSFALKADTQSKRSAVTDDSGDSTETQTREKLFTTRLSQYSGAASDVLSSLLRRIDHLKNVLEENSVAFQTEILQQLKTLLNAEADDCKRREKYFDQTSLFNKKDASVDKSRDPFFPGRPGAEDKRRHVVLGSLRDRLIRPFVILPPGTDYEAALKAFRGCSKIAKEAGFGFAPVLLQLETVRDRLSADPQYAVKLLEEIDKCRPYLCVGVDFTGLSSWFCTDMFSANANASDSSQSPSLDEAEGRAKDEFHGVFSWLRRHIWRSAASLCLTHGYGRASRDMARTIVVLDVSNKKRRNASTIFLEEVAVSLSLLSNETTRARLVDESESHSLVEIMASELEVLVRQDVNCVAQLAPLLSTNTSRDVAASIARLIGIETETQLSTQLHVQRLWEACWEQLALRSITRHLLISGPAYCWKSVMFRQLCSRFEVVGNGRAARTSVRCRTLWRAASMSSSTQLFVDIEVFVRQSLQELWVLHGGRRDVVSDQARLDTVLSCLRARYRLVVLVDVCYEDRTNTASIDNVDRFEEFLSRIKDIVSVVMLCRKGTVEEEAFSKFGRHVLLDQSGKALDLSTIIDAAKKARSASLSTYVSLPNLNVVDTSPSDDLKSRRQIYQSYVRLLSKVECEASKLAFIALCSVHEPIHRRELGLAVQRALRKLKHETGSNSLRKETGVDVMLSSFVREGVFSLADDCYCVCSPVIRAAIADEIAKPAENERLDGSPDWKTAVLLELLGVFAEYGETLRQFHVASEIITIVEAFRGSDEAVRWALSWRTLLIAFERRCKSVSLKEWLSVLAVVSTVSPLELRRRESETLLQYSSRALPSLQLGEPLLFSEGEELQSLLEIRFSILLLLYRDLGHRSCLRELLKKRDNYVGSVRRNRSATVHDLIAVDGLLSSNLPTSEVKTALTLLQPAAPFAWAVVDPNPYSPSVVEELTAGILSGLLRRGLYSFSSALSQKIWERESREVEEKRTFSNCLRFHALRANILSLQTMGRINEALERLISLFVSCPSLRQRQGWLGALNWREKVEGAVWIALLVKEAEGLLGRSRCAPLSTAEELLERLWAEVPVEETEEQQTEVVVVERRRRKSSESMRERSSSNRKAAADRVLSEGGGVKARRSSVEQLAEHKESIEEMMKKIGGEDSLKLLDEKLSSAVLSAENAVSRDFCVTAILIAWRSGTVWSEELRVAFETLIRIFHDYGLSSAKDAVREVWKRVSPTPIMDDAGVDMINSDEVVVLTDCEKPLFFLSCSSEVRRGLLEKANAFAMEKANAETALDLYKKCVQHTVEGGFGLDWSRDPAGKLVQISPQFPLSSTADNEGVIHSTTLQVYLGTARVALGTSLYASALWNAAVCVLLCRDAVWRCQGQGGRGRSWRSVLKKLLRNSRLESRETAFLSVFLDHKTTRRSALSVEDVVSLTISMCVREGPLFTSTMVEASLIACDCLLSLQYIEEAALVLRTVVARTGEGADRTYQTRLYGHLLVSMLDRPLRSASFCFNDDNSGRRKGTEGKKHSCCLTNADLQVLGSEFLVPTKIYWRRIFESLPAFSLACSLSDLIVMARMSAFCGRGQDSLRTLDTIVRSSDVQQDVAKKLVKAHVCIALLSTASLRDVHFFPGGANDATVSPTTLDGVRDDSARQCQAALLQSLQNDALKERYQSVFHSFDGAAEEWLSAFCGLSIKPETSTSTSASPISTTPFNAASLFAASLTRGLLSSFTEAFLIVRCVTERSLAAYEALRPYHDSLFLGLTTDAVLPSEKLLRTALFVAKDALRFLDGFEKGLTEWICGEEEEKSFLRVETFEARAFVLEVLLHCTFFQYQINVPSMREEGSDGVDSNNAKGRDGSKGPAKAVVKGDRLWLSYLRRLPSQEKAGRLRNLLIASEELRSQIVLSLDEAIAAGKALKDPIETFYFGEEALSVRSVLSLKLRCLFQNAFGQSAPARADLLSCRESLSSHVVVLRDLLSSREIEAVDDDASSSTFSLRVYVEATQSEGVQKKAKKADENDREAAPSPERERERGDEGRSHESSLLLRRRLDDIMRRFTAAEGEVLLAFGLVDWTEAGRVETTNTTSSSKAGELRIRSGQYVDLAARRLSDAHLSWAEGGATFDLLFALSRSSARNVRNLFRKV